MIPTDKQKAQLKLQQYLEANDLRQTMERKLILNTIYDAHEHVDAEYLFQHFKERKHPISLATIYNVLDLLLTAQLIRQHQLTGQKKTYEKNSTRQHDHHICLTCGRVTEFCHPKIQSIQDTVSQTLGFAIHSHDLTLYGHCRAPKCPYIP